MRICLTFHFDTKAKAGERVTAFSFRSLECITNLDPYFDVKSTKRSWQQFELHFSHWGKDESSWVWRNKSEASCQKKIWRTLKKNANKASTDKQGILRTLFFRGKKCHAMSGNVDSSKSLVGILGISRVSLGIKEPWTLPYLIFIGL